MRHVVLITGVAGGIGRATAKLFSAEGWTVVGVDHKAIKLSGGLFIRADCTKPEEILRVVAKVEKENGHLDALVNNAAIQVNKPVMVTSVAEWDNLMAINLRAPFLFAKECRGLLKRSAGSIVNVASVHAVATSMNVSAYAASKGGLISLTRALAIEWAKDKIRVNAVLPGAVDTPMLWEGLNRGHLRGKNMARKLRMLGQRTVLGRVAQPEEIAEAIRFLADQTKAAFITGQSLIIDGGATTKLSNE